jgi:hypothetical protein
MRSSFSRVGQLFSSFLGLLWKIDHNQRYINDDTNICRHNLIELTPSGEHDDSLKYTNIPDNSSNHYTLTTNRTSAEKKTDGRQQGPKNMDENWFYMSREGQPLYYSTSDRNKYFLYQNSCPVLTVRAWLLIIYWYT